MNIYEFLALIVLSVMWCMVTYQLSAMVIGKTPTIKQVIIVGIFAGPFAWAIFGGCYAYEYYKSLMAK
jgi:hypothetical protein